MQTQLIVNQLAGETVYGPLSIRDIENRVHCHIADWAVGQVDITVEVSFDNGVTWKSQGSMRCLPGARLRDGTPGASIGVDTIEQQCLLCGELYLPGDRRYDRALSHCTVRLRDDKTLLQMRARLRQADRGGGIQAWKLRLLVDADDNDIDAEFLERTFHAPIPDLRQDRLIRVRVLSASNISTVINLSATVF